MAQDSDLPVKGLSVLKGGKKETPVVAGESKTADKEKLRVDVNNADAKVSSLIHALARQLIKKTPDLPEFPQKFHVMTDTKGECFILEETDNQQVMHVSNTRLSHCIMHYIASHNYPLGMHKITHDHMGKIIQEFMALAPKLEEPAMVLEKSQPGLTYRKLPFDFESDPGLERSPTFKEMMGRTTNAPALMQWIGSIFDPDADLQQYVWLYGIGQNGKSALGRFLSVVLGEGSISVQPPGLHDRFWTINLIGKRLVIYGDCNNAKFVTSGLFKSMTGGDTVSAEIKMGATLQVRLKAKHLYFSNKKPGIDSGEADQRRIILCEMAGIACPPDPHYEGRLWDEAPTFLGECINQYLTQAGPKRRIVCDQTAAKELALENDEELEVLFNARFVLDADSFTPAVRVQEILRSAGYSRSADLKRFREFLTHNYGIAKVKSHGVYQYRGMRPGI